MTFDIMLFMSIKTDCEVRFFQCATLHAWKTLEPRRFHNLPNAHAKSSFLASPLSANYHPNLMKLD